MFHVIAILILALVLYLTLHTPVEAFLAAYPATAETAAWAIPGFFLCAIPIVLIVVAAYMIGCGRKAKMMGYSDQDIADAKGDWIKKYL